MTPQEGRALLERVPEGQCLTVGPEGELALEEGQAGDFLAAYGDVIYDILYGEQYIADKVNRTGD